MQNIDLNEVKEYVEDNIGTFHEARIEGINKLKLETVLSRKNPYLFKAKNISTAQDIVKALVDAYLSSSEEALFGEFLEKLAIFISFKVYSGKKSSTEGIDLEFDKEGARYLVSIKSGPNWGNSQQIKRMEKNFIQARKILHTNSTLKNIICINGCCYGNVHNDKGTYFKICGQEFWTLISGDEDLYTKIIEPLGYKAEEKNEEFTAKYNKTLNKFTREFIEEFCTPEGEIMWEKIVKLNSGKKEAKRPQKSVSKRKKSSQTILVQIDES